MALKCPKLLFQLHNFQKFSGGACPWTPLETRALRPLHCQVPATLNFQPPPIKSLENTAIFSFDTVLHCPAARRDESTSHTRRDLFFRNCTVTCILNIVRSYLKLRKSTLMSCPHLRGPFIVIEGQIKVALHN